MIKLLKNNVKFQVNLKVDVIVLQVFKRALTKATMCMSMK